MGVDASDDATSRARRVSTTSTSERRGTVMMSIAVMAVSSLMTLGIKRGVEGRGSSAFATPFKAALGQRMKHSTWDESNQHDGGNAADDGFVSYEQQRDFEGREWAWEKRISCDGHEALDFDVDAVEALMRRLRVREATHAELEQQLKTLRVASGPQAVEMVRRYRVGGGMAAGPAPAVPAPSPAPAAARASPAIVTRAGWPVDNSYYASRLQA